MIELDSNFETILKRYGFTRNNARLRFMNVLSNYSNNKVVEAANIFKVCSSINCTIGQVIQKILKIIATEEEWKTGEGFQERRQDVLALLLLFLDESKHPEAGKYVKKERNIEKEVTADLYNEPYELFYDRVDSDEVNDKKIEKMKEIGLHSYDIMVPDDPNVGWDEHYFNICAQVARNSKCFSRRIGAILVRDKRVISTGYNGPAEGQPTCDYRWVLDKNFKEKFFDDEPKWSDVKGLCPRQVIGFKSGEGMEWCPAVHAEENTILNCARMGISSKGTTMYMTCGIPCSKCLVKIINAGVKELVVSSFTWYDETSKYILENSDVKVRLYDFFDKSDLNNF